MGVTRKLMSLSSLGLVDFRSDKERIARSTRRTDKAVRAQTKTVRAQQREAPAFPAVPPAAVAPVGPPPGWYEDARRPGMRRWWDGYRWTEHLAPTEEQRRR